MLGTVGFKFAPSTCKNRSRQPSAADPFDTLRTGKLHQSSFTFPSEQMIDHNRFCLFDMAAFLLLGDPMGLPYRVRPKPAYALTPNLTHLCLKKEVFERPPSLINDRNPNVEEDYLGSHLRNRLDSRKAPRLAETPLK